MEFTLRPWKKEDLEFVAKNAGDKEITGNMSDAFPDSVEKWAKFLEYVVGNNDILYLAIDINGEAVGGIGVKPMDDIYRKNAEMGYWLAKKYWGKGIITQAIKLMVKKAFETFNIDRISATPFETNIASHKVLEKAGFILEARFAKKVVKNGNELDELVYVIKKDNL